MDKLLFTPGPLTTSVTVKEKMNKDLGSRDTEFVNVVSDIRKGLLDLAGIEHCGKYEAILMQGAGTFGVESVISTVVPQNGCLLVVVNGAYGRRIASIAQIHDIETIAIEFKENETPDLVLIRECVEQNPNITHIAVVHCETTTGIFNELNAIGQIAKEAGIVYIVDAMSSFGAVPISFEDAKIDYLISSSNKCIEGVPGFSFILANTQLLSQCKQQSRTLSLDLYAQWEGLNSNGQFRFTPPIQSMLAFSQAILELKDEGGVEGRSRRYKTNNKMLLDGMMEVGFKPYLDKEVRGWIITSFEYPKDKNFDFQKFFNFLNERGFVIYPGKLTETDTFRIGNIGHVQPSDIQRLLKVVRDAVLELKIDL